ncbi:MAG: glycosyltransferase family 2 protein [Alphaproteobacteria bacterium]|nr:glycosyltransferase family 2 protein [Alphaproteobacteria bacterium]MBV8549045.1 glycosyltransferase family 2 protein [Alphaproteobacteria bacterium]
MVAAIIVTYNPEEDRFTSLLNAIVPQVDHVIVVDNGSTVPVKTWIDAVGDRNIIWHPLDSNKGIATAHNEGIRRAHNLGAKYVIIFDHDSGPAPDLVATLIAALQQKEAEGFKVAAVGPCYSDPRRNNPPPFLYMSGLRMKRRAYDPAQPIVPVIYLITSGSLIPMATLDEVGGMRDALFIDYVDLEWGLRANAKGYQSFGVFAGKMQHNLGDETATVFGYKFALHSPLRHYYMFRNNIWLWRQSFVPLQWKLIDALRFPIRFVSYAVFSKPHGKHIAMMLRGMLDGMRDKLGKYNP